MSASPTSSELKQRNKPNARPQSVVPCSSEASRNCPTPGQPSSTLGGDNSGARENSIAAASIATPSIATGRTSAAANSAESSASGRVADGLVNGGKVSVATRHLTSHKPADPRPQGRLSSRYNY